MTDIDDIVLTEEQLNAASRGRPALEAACTELGGLAEHTDRKRTAPNRWTYLTAPGRAANVPPGVGQALLDEGLITADWEGGNITTYAGTRTGSAALRRIGRES